MRLAAREVVTSRHTYNLVELPLVVAGKTGTAEFGTRDAKGRLPFHNWFVGFVPAHGDVAKPDSKLAVARLRLRLEHGRQRGDRDGQVLPPDPLSPPRGSSADRTSLRKRQLLRWQLMGVLKVEPARAQDWAARSVGADLARLRPAADDLRPAR